MKKAEEKMTEKKKAAVMMTEEELNKVNGGEGAFDGFPRMNDKEIGEELTEGNRA